MHNEGFFYQAFVFLAATVISVPISKRLGMGSVLGYLVAGIAIGPFGLGLIGQNGQDIMHFAEFGVVMMLFLIGLELEPRMLWRMRRALVGMGGLQMTISVAVIGGITWALGLGWRPALAVGLILAVSSTAIVLQTLGERGRLQTDAGQSAFSVLLFQDIAVIPILAVLPLLATTSSGPDAAEHGSTWLDGQAAWAQTLIVLSAVGGIIVAGLFLVRPVFRFIAKSKLRETFTAAALLLVIGIAILMSKVGLSPALGTFIAGVVLGGSEYRHELESDIEPFKGLLLGLFFIAVGASIDFSLIAAQPGTVALIVGALIFIKYLVLLLLGRIFKLNIDQNLVFAVSLAQTGEFGFVLFSYAAQHQVIPADIVALLVAVVALSMGLTPLLFAVNEKIVLKILGTHEGPVAEADTIDTKGQVIIAGFGRFGNIVGRILRANGILPTVLDLDPDNVEILRKLGIKVFYGDACRPGLLLAAGADEARVLVVALDDHEKNLKIIRLAQKHFPQLTILARAPGRHQAYDLLDAGVTHVYRETLDSSLRLGVDALKALGYHPHQAYRAARTFRRHDERSVDDLRQMRGNHKRYLTEAKERIHDLEQLLLSEFDQVDITTDAAWDSSSRREEMLRHAEKPT